MMRVTNPLGIYGYGTALPATDSGYQIFYNTTNSTLYVLVAGVWTAISGGSTPATGTIIPHWFTMIPQ